MDRSNWPLLLIEGVLVFGGAIGFGWWQLRDVERDRRAAARRRQQDNEKPQRPEETATADSRSTESQLSQNIDR